MNRIIDLQTALLDLLQKVHDSDIRLTGPQSRFQGTRVKTDTRRARPRPSVGIHAHPVKEFGRYHALDLYTILATTTEKEWEYSLHLRDQYKDDPLAKEAGNLVSEYFSSQERLGMIRLMESPYYRSALLFSFYFRKKDKIK
jgi:hypothetical protein